MDEQTKAELRRISDETHQRLQAALAPYLGRMTGTAAQQRWPCEDGYRVSYTTSRVEGGPHHGKFLVQLHKPVGKGARTGTAKQWVESYRREFSTRKAAKARAIELFRRHSPKWDAKHPKASAAEPEEGQ